MENTNGKLSRIMPKHAYEVAELHYTYTDSLLRDLGRRMCHVFYENAMKNEHMFGYVYIIESKVVGFIIGTTDNSKIFGSFKVSLHIILSLLKNPHLLRKVLAHRKISSKGMPEALYSAVEREYRKRGIAFKLYKAVNNDFRRRGIRYMEGFVDSENKLALIMCKFTGWKIKEKFNVNGKFLYRLYNLFD